MMLPQSSSLLPRLSNTNLSISRASRLLFLFSDAPLSVPLQKACSSLSLRSASSWEASGLSCCILESFHSLRL